MSLPTSPPMFVPPTQIEEYRLIQKLGAGSTGQVYLAEDMLLRRLVAIKFLTSEHSSDQLHEDLLREARAAARVVHPNVVQLYRVSILDGLPYLVTEYLRGQSLRELSLPVPPDRLLPIAREILRGLAAVHRMQILHRDVKPANIILTEEGVIKLLDFGLAKVGPAVHTTLPSMLEAEPTRNPTVFAGSQAATLSGPGVPSAPPLPASSGSPQSERTSPMDCRGPGTPLYMAPEVWKGESATVRSDLYSAAAVLYELATGGRAFSGTTWQELEAAVLTAPLIPVRQLAPHVTPRIATAIERCLSRLTIERPETAEDFLVELEDPTLPIGVIPTDLDTPFRGLFAFESQHRAVFLGRTRDIESIVQLLRAEPLVTVVGDSGVGKSSLCRAGVLPMVAEGALEAQRQWRTLTISPGRKPLLCLADALSSLLQVDSDSVRALLLQQPEQLTRLIMKMQGPSLATLIFIDQLEELVTESDPVEALAIGELITLCASRLPGLRLLVTVRSDYLVRVLEHTDLRDHLTRAVYLVRPLRPPDLREVILGPVTAMGFRFESEETITEMIESSGSDGGSLPLLQFALSELWLVRDPVRKLIPTQALAKIGGVRGALGSHADSVYQRLFPSEKQAARWMLTAMVHADNTRAALTEQELTHDSAHSQSVTQSALEALIRGRLIHARQSTSSQNSYELAHEALVREWSLLRSWLSTDQERRELESALRHAAAEWIRLGRPTDELWGERRLHEVQRLGVSRTPQCTHVQSFLRSSQRQERLRHGLRIAIWIGVPILLVSGGGLIVWNRNRDRDLHRSELLLRATRLSGAIQRDGTSTKATIEEAQALRKESEHTTDLATKAVLQKSVFDVATAGGSMGMLDVGAKIEAVDFSPDDRQVVIASGTKTWFWDLKIPKTTPVTIEHGSKVRYAGYFPSGERLLSVSEDGQAKIARPASKVSDWILRAPRGKILFAQPFCSEQDVVGTDDQGSLLFWNRGTLIKTIALSLPADRLLTDPSCQQVIIKTKTRVLSYTPQTGKLETLHTIKVTEEIPALDMSSDAHFVAMTGPEGKVLIVDLIARARGMKAVKVSPIRHLGPVRLIHFQRNTHNLLSVGTENVVPIRDADNGSVMQRLRGQSVETNDASFSCDGSRAVTGHEDGSIRIWDANTGGVLGRYNQGGQEVNGAWFSHGGRFLVTTSTTGRVFLWDSWLGANSLLAGHRQPVRSAEFSADNRLVLTAGADGTARIWDRESGHVNHILQHAEGEYHSVTLLPEAHFSPDGTMVVTGGSDGRVLLWNVQDGVRMELLHNQPESEIRAVKFSNDGRVIVAISNDGKAYVWDTATRRLGAVLNHHNEVRTMAIAADSQWLVTGADDGRVRVWNLNSQREIIIKQFTPLVLKVATSPNSDWAAASGTNGVVHVESLRGERFCQQKISGGWIWDLAFSADGNRLFASAADGSISMLTMDGCRWQPLMEGGGDSVRSIHYLSGATESIVATRTDGTVMILDLAGNVRLRFVAHSAGLIGATISRDSHWLATFSTDRTARIYQISPDSVAEQLAQTSQWRLR